MRFIEGSPAYGKQEKGVKKTLPVGVSPQMQGFLSDARLSDAYQSLDLRRETLINTYYFSNVSTSDLSSMAGVKSRQHVSHLIRSAMETLWINVPENIKAQYVKEEVIKLKDKTSMVVLKNSKPPTTETRRKISEANKGKPSPMKGLSRSPETRAKMSKAHKGKEHSHSAEAKTKMSESQLVRRLRERSLTAANAVTDHVIFDTKAPEDLG